MRNFILNWNIRSFNKNIDELKLLVFKYQPEIVTLQESYISDRFLTHSPLNNYTWLSKKSSITHHSITIGIKKKLPFKQMPINTDIPTLCIHITTPFNIHIVCTYVSPNSSCDISSEFQKIFFQIPSPILIIGDFNAQHKEWGSLITTSRGTDIENILTLNQALTLTHNFPTRIDPSTGNSSTIDHCIISSAIAAKFSSFSVKDLHGSDHFPIIVQINEIPINNLQLSNRPRWKYEEANWVEYYKFLENIPWNAISVNETRLIELIHEAAQSSIPKTNGIPPKKFAPWWNKEVALAIKNRRKCLRQLTKHRRTGNIAYNANVFLAKFKEANQIAKNMIKQAKEQTWEKFVNEMNPSISSKELWRRVKQLGGKGSKPTIPILNPRNPITNPVEIADAFATHFSSISSNNSYPDSFLKYKTKSESKTPSFVTPCNIEYNNPFSIEELQFALKKCRGKSAGPDGIGYPLLQHLPICALNYLLEIYNNIWKSGKIPNHWKNSFTIPIPKNNRNPHDVDSFRPISLINCIAKILERMVNRRLCHELEKRKLLHTSQHAFRKGYGSETYFAKLEELLSNANKKNWHSNLAILDLAKAYDITWRHAILKQLYNWDFRGNLPGFIANFLLNRTFSVIIGSCLSQQHTLENGVPQGAILSPTLFIISIQSLFQFIPSNITPLIYADDIVLISSASTNSLSINQLQLGINRIKQWCSLTGFQVSPEKCKILHINTVKQKNKSFKSIPISYNNSTIPKTRQAKILGITFDSNLSFHPHFKNIKKITKYSMNLFKILGGGSIRASRSILLRLLNCWMLPKILYGTEILSLEKDRFNKLLAPAYHTALRYSSGAFITSPINSLLCESGQLPFAYRITQHLVNSALRCIEKNLHSVPLVQRANTDFYNLTGIPLPRILKLPSTVGRPWNQPLPKIDWTMRNLSRLNTKHFFQSFCDHIHKHYQNHYKIYTDGSIHNQSAGCGIHSLKSNCAIKLPDNTSVFSAEAIAVGLAIEEDTEENTPNVIFSDSASVLTALEYGCTRDPHIQAIDLSSKLNNISFCWIPSHVGIPGNEVADRLANEGRRSSNINHHPISKKDATKSCKLLLSKSWQKSWQNELDNLLRTNKLSILPWEDHPCHSSQRLLTRLRIGHTRLTHSYRLNKEPPPTCPNCGVQITVRHILTECLAYNAERKICDLDDNIDTILSSDLTAQKKVLKFIRLTELDKKI